MNKKELTLYHGSTVAVEFPEIRTARALETLKFVRGYDVYDES